MSKKIFIYLFCYGVMMISTNGRAQNVDERSTVELQGLLNRSIADTGRIKLQLALSRKLLFKSGASKDDIGKADLLMRQAAHLSLALRDVRWQAHSALMATLIYNQRGERDKGLTEAQKALALFTKINDTAGQGEAYILIGQHYNNDGPEMKTKIGYYQKAADIFIGAGKHERAAATLKDIGDLLTLKNELPEALKYLQAALVQYKTIKFKDIQGLYDLLGAVYTRMGDYTEGLKYGLLAEKTAAAQKDSSLQLCPIYNRIGFTYNVMKQYNYALIYRQKAIAIAKKYRDTASMTIININIIATYFSSNRVKDVLGVLKEIDGYYKTKPLDLSVQLTFIYLKYYLTVNEFGLARRYYEKLSAFEGQLADLPTLEEVRLRGEISYLQSTEQWGKSYALAQEHLKFCREKGLTVYSYGDEKWFFRADSALKRYSSAIKHFQRYKEINDSVFNEKKIQQTALLRVQYETDRKDNELLLKAKDIQLLTKRNELQQVQSAQVKMTRNVTLVGTALLALLLAVGYNRFRLKQRSNLLLQAQQSEINDQNQTLKILNTRQNALLKEKEWLLREIHHRVKNNLQITMSLLNIQSAYMMNNDALEAIQNSQRRMQAMSLIHQKLYQSENLALIDMAVYIKELVTYLKESFQDIKSVSFELDTPSLELDIAQAVPVGLILNEAITNSIKYAFPDHLPGKIFISLKQFESSGHRLTVADNGIGLPDSFVADSQNSLGINLMRGLADQLDGNIEVKNQNGTLISLTFHSVDLMKETLNILEMQEA